MVGSLLKSSILSYTLFWNQRVWILFGAQWKAGDVLLGDKTAAAHFGPVQSSGSFGVLAVSIFLTQTPSLGRQQYIMLPFLYQGSMHNQLFKLRYGNFIMSKLGHWRALCMVFHRPVLVGLSTIVVLQHGCIVTLLVLTSCPARHRFILIGTNLEHVYSFKP